MNLLDTLYIVVKSVEKFLEVSEKKKLQKSNLFKIKWFKSNLDFTFRNHPFWREFFFRGPPEIFLRTLRLCSRYLKVLPKVVLYTSKKFMAVRRTNTIIFQEKWKKFGFWNLELRLWFEYSDKTTIFEVKLFFRGPLENFLYT